MGKKIGTEKISQRDQLIAEVEDYFKAMGDTTELKKLQKLINYKPDTKLDKILKKIINTKIFDINVR